MKCSRENMKIIEKENIEYKTKMEYIQVPHKKTGKLQTQKTLILFKI